MEEIIKSVIYAVVPSAISLYAVYAVVRSFLLKEMNKTALDLKIKNAETVLPIRLQAYERMAIFLERNSLQHLLPRTPIEGFNAVQFQHLLIACIREEYNHNVSQQVYISEEMWSVINSAVEETVALINNVAMQIADEAPAIELAKVLFETVMNTPEQPTRIALSYLKKEVQELF